MKYVLICTIFKRSPKKVKKTWIESTRPKQMLRRPIAAITTRVRCSIFLKKIIQVETWKRLFELRPIAAITTRVRCSIFLKKTTHFSQHGVKIERKKESEFCLLQPPRPTRQLLSINLPTSDGLWKLNIHFMNDFLLVLATFKNLPVERVPSQKENCWDFMCVWLMSWWSVNSLLFDPSQGVGHSQALRGLQSLWLGNNCCLDSAISNMYSTFNSWCLVRKKERFVRKKKLSKCQNVQLILCDTKLHVCQRTSLPKIFFLALLGAGLAGQVQPCEDNSVWRPSPN